MRSGGGAVADAGPGSLVLNGVTVTGNQVRRAVSAFGQGGGGVFVSRGDLNMTGTRVTGNSVTTTQQGFNDGGGGILGLYGAVNIAMSTISSNTVSLAQSTGDGGGGGILVTGVGHGWPSGGEVTFTDLTISGNRATVAPIASESVDANGGGGIYADGGIAA